MSKIKILFGLGIITVLIPFLGVPRTWKDVLIIIAGIVIAVLSYLVHREQTKMHQHGAGEDENIDLSSGSLH